MTRQELKNECMIVAHQECSNRGYSFSSEANRQLHELIATGVDRMTIEDMNNPVKCQLAVSNIKTFVFKLCERKRRERSGVILENCTFSQGRLSICPLWPFC